MTITELEKKRTSLEQEINRLDQEYATQITLQTITKHQIKHLIIHLADELHEKDKSKLKNLINSMVDRITLDPLTLECRIHYKIAVENGPEMASPGGFEPPLPP